MRARLVRIGNSRGIRLAKPLIEQLGLTDEVELEAHDGALVIRPAQHERSGWAEAARRLASTEPEALAAPMPTRFEEKEWEWR